MALSERQIHDAYDALHETFGDKTDIVIGMLRTPEGELATKHDLTAVRADFSDLRGDFSDIRGEFSDLRGEFSDIRGEFSNLRGEFSNLRGEFADLRADFTELRETTRADMAGLEMRLERRIGEELRQQTRSLMFMIIGAVVLMMLSDTLQSVLG